LTDNQLLVIDKTYLRELKNPLLFTLAKTYVGFYQPAKNHPDRQLKARKSAINRLDNSPVATTKIKDYHR
jgi:hypothetical protein